MNKITAVGKLMSGECDLVMHGTSEFILHGEDVVNKRSKKALDMKKMLEEGWDIKSLPRWDDALREGAVVPTLCVLEKEEFFIIVVSMTEDGEYMTSYGEMITEDVFGPLRPATKEEALSLLPVVKDTPRQKTKPKAKTESKPKGEDIPKPDKDKAKETAQEAESIDLINIPSPVDNGKVDTSEDPDEIDLTTPFDLDPEPKTKAHRPKKVKTPKQPVKQKEECQTENDKSTPSPKEEIGTFKQQYVDLGLNQEMWGEFCSYCFEHKIDIADKLAAGAKVASGVVIDFGSYQARQGKVVGTGIRRDSTNHESDDVIVDKLEVFVDFGLESEDAIAFYDYHKLDKFKLQSIVSEATDGRVTEMVTQFYDDMGE